MLRGRLVSVYAGILMRQYTIVLSCAGKCAWREGGGVAYRHDIDLVILGRASSARVVLGWC